MHSDEVGKVEKNALLIRGAIMIAVTVLVGYIGHYW